MAKKPSASSAYAASVIQKTLGRIPGYAQNKKKISSAETSSRLVAAKEAAALLLKNPKQHLHALKISISSKHGIAFLKNSEILRFIPKSNHSLHMLLLKSPTRTLSGISPIAVMPLPALCGGHCTYCPRGEGAPQSYTGYEPTTMRAIQNKFSARKQIESRLRQYASQGHTTDKCHLIVMGGTFLYSGIKESYRHAFMKEAFETLNRKKSLSLRAAINANEFALHRAIGTTYETRPDFALEYHADEMLSMGGTQVEMGVQALSDRVYRLVRRGHTVKDVINSTRILKNSGFKLCYHMMPGLWSTPKQDVSYFRRLFSSQDFQPDMLKIYPVLVLQGTPLYNQWKHGDFMPYDTETAADVIAQATRYIPPYVRIPRIQRDIPSPLVSAGVKNSNLRQIVDKKLAERDEKCRCIRCREIGSEERKGGKTGKLHLELQRINYKASGGKEIFLSFEDTKKDLLAGFLRLRIPGESHRKEIGSFSSIVRELHVYGQEAAIGEQDSAKQQHKGLGKQLLAAAEEITREEEGLEKICVISGPGARGYYRKLGYSLDGPYMAKTL
ncbi:MAG: tRNA uridine(34) 5-carboxymethylaminomethyl modification radical SAM/GNAT enzyme Elp3 [Candidatus Micrarchaeota archaeon]|nr:tRNA uridine(34) 5-carboxymethylaminomethyl modification radical SAM/GNAT enzyme Elp3 [Candidatus Micrarchaeota archaeon]